MNTASCEKEAPSLSRDEAMAILDTPDEELEALIDRASSLRYKYKMSLQLKNCSIKVMLRIIKAGNFLDSVKIILNSISYLYKILIRKQRILYYL